MLGKDEGSTGLGPESFTGCNLFMKGSLYNESKKHTWMSVDLLLALVFGDRFSLWTPTIHKTASAMF